MGEWKPGRLMRRCMDGRTVKLAMEKPRVPDETGRNDTGDNQVCPNLHFSFFLPKKKKKKYMKKNWSCNLRFWWGGSYSSLFFFFPRAASLENVIFFFFFMTLKIVLSTLERKWFKTHRTFYFIFPRKIEILGKLVVKKREKKKKKKKKKTLLGISWLLSLFF